MGVSATRLSIGHTIQEDTITIGLIVNNLREGRGIIEAARLSVTQANESGDGHGYKLAYRITDGPWEQASNKAVELVHEEKATVIIGSLDGRSAHLVEQVAAKAQIPYIETKSTDPTLSKAFVPWFFRLPYNADQIAIAFSEDIYLHSKFNRVATIVDNGYDNMMAMRSFRKHVQGQQYQLPDSLYYNSVEDDISTLTKQISEGSYEAIVLFTNQRSELFANVLLESGAMIYQTKPIILMNRNKVKYPLKVINVVNNLHDYSQLLNFLDLKYGTKPSVSAVYVYDACELIIRNIDKTNGDPVRIGENLKGTESFLGISGQISFDVNGNIKRKLNLKIVK